MPVLSQLFGAGRSESVRTRAAAEVYAMGPTQVRAHVDCSTFAQSGTAPGRASRHSPTGSALRANPCPEVTDPVCRLPLPTLFYRPEAFHLGDLLRIWVRACTKITPSPSDFQGPTRAHRTPQEPWCFAGLWSLSPGEPIPGSPPLTKKRELFPGLAPASPSSFASPHLAP